MPRINVLDKHIAELIAAGEVVERPSSVIKELIENSIDALATTITVEIVSGGVSMMRITDNGYGITREDVPKAFLRHSTSKITSEIDLDTIGTLGFRGEALASVAAVSKTEMLTRSENDEIGTRFLIEGGEQVSIEEVGCPVGTTITVRDLFFNTPARMKFLKRDVSEGTAVAAVLDRIALSHPEISFRLIREGKEVLLTPGDCDLKSAVYAVYGKEFAAGLIPVEYELGGVTVSGLISKPSAARSNRNMQLFYINDRYVRSRTMMAALEVAYKGMIMAGKFPACVLSIGIPFDRVDVNVHPAKIEVRFTNERPVFDAVHYAAKNALSQRDTRPEMHINNPVVPKQALPISSGHQLGFNSGSTLPNKAIDIFCDKDVIKSEEKTNITFPKIHEPQPLMAGEYHFKNYSTDQNKPVEIDKVVEEKLPNKDGVTQNSSEFNISSENKFLNLNNEAQAEQTDQSTDVSRVLYLGEAFDAYVIIEVREGLMFIDKHAAHERILYNKLKENARDERQMLIAPITVALSKEEYNALTQNLDLVLKSGFEIDDFGEGTVLVRSVPAILDKEDISSLIIEIAGGLIINTRTADIRQLDDILHSVACRAAVKAGNKSSKAELMELVGEISASNEIRYCPHGRPVAFLLKRREIEKQFGRII